jgi:hypothetical protein
MGHAHGLRPQASDFRLQTLAAASQLSACGYRLSAFSYPLAVLWCARRLFSDRQQHGTGTAGRFSCHTPSIPIDSGPRKLVHWLLGCFDGPMESSTLNPGCARHEHSTGFACSPRRSAFRSGLRRRPPCERRSSRMPTRNTRGETRAQSVIRYTRRRCWFLLAAGKNPGLMVQDCPRRLHDPRRIRFFLLFSFFLFPVSRSRAGVSVRHEFNTVRPRTADHETPPGLDPRVPR